LDGLGRRVDDFTPRRGHVLGESDPERIEQGHEDVGKQRLRVGVIRQMPFALENEAVVPGDSNSHVAGSRDWKIRPLTQAAQACAEPPPGHWSARPWCSLGPYRFEIWPRLELHRPDLRKSDARKLQRPEPSTYPQVNRQ
jgi:hypothetical protein